jgi:hypothetical protein
MFNFIDIYIFMPLHCFAREPIMLLRRPWLYIDVINKLFNRYITQNTAFVVKMFQIIVKLKYSHVVTSIEQSPVLKDHLFPVLS